MNAIYKLKDTVVGYLSPKRQRTTEPSPGTSATDHDALFLAPPAEQKQEPGEASPITFEKTSVSYTLTTELVAQNGKKRTREEFEFEEESNALSPDDSISQVIARSESQEGTGNSAEEDEEKGEREDEEGVSDEVSDLLDGNEDEGSDVELEQSKEAAELASDEEEVESESGEEDDEVESSDKDQETEEDEEEAGDDRHNLEEGSVDPDSSNQPIVYEGEEIGATPEPTAEEKVAEFLARQAELESRKQDIEKARAAGDWHPDGLILYERLMMRSFEEIIPIGWRMDFPTLPEVLFAREKENTFINANSLIDGRACRALQGILKVGVGVRDKILVGRPTEKFIEKQIKDYIKWSEQDGGYHKKRFIPVLTVVAAKPGQSTEFITKSMTNQMQFLAERHREYLGVHINADEVIDSMDANKRAPPLLYGIIVAQHFAIFVTLDSADPKATLKSIEHFDFTKKNMDVWNGFALAIMVIMARNYLMSIRDELETDDEPESDVDA
ncbi:hypothetical protein BGZ60DRAFT_525715 [Tricladium varicosporioides]|nr:hypothetical protein BGZ60DRAFT_525715 [Hymenoscyphus varicosporioides]